jgi:hypothetical protein
VTGYDTIDPGLTHDLDGYSSLLPALPKPLA